MIFRDNYRKELSVDSRMNRYQLNKDIVKNAIYLDFEGEGRKGDHSIPCPHIAGLYRPFLEGYKYSVLFFKEAWKPVKNGHNVERDRIGDFKSLMTELIEEAEQEGRLIIFWTIHERTIIELHAPELLERFDRVGFNLHKPAKRFANKRNLLRDKDEKKGLNQFLKLLKKASPLIIACKPTAAEACRRIDNYSSKKRRWRLWTDEQKGVARDLIRYNKDDCLAVLKLARKLGNSVY
ncbi:hypothetical protein XMG59_002309 [Marinobacterium sp. xm-g-59]|nr:hypothetical protein [Marinobacterium sp. xm-g-59]